MNNHARSKQNSKRLSLRVKPKKKSAIVVKTVRKEKRPQKAKHISEMYLPDNYGDNWDWLKENPGGFISQNLK
jgi:hypothetical protein